MSFKIYVGNLSFDATEDNLNEWFGSFGEVLSARIIKDQMSGRSKGFAFVEMGSEDAGQSAISSLDGQEKLGRPLRVNQAKEREDRPRGGGGGGSRGGFGGGGPRRDGPPRGGGGGGGFRGGRGGGGGGGGGGFRGGRGGGFGGGDDRGNSF